MQEAIIAFSDRHFNIKRGGVCIYYKNNHRELLSTNNQRELFIKIYKFRNNDCLKIYTLVKGVIMTISVFACYSYVSNSIYKPLDFFFKQSMKSGTFPNECKKRNIAGIHKKDDKQCLKSYRPASLLPICGKKFEKLIFNEMFKLFIGNKLISPNQSGFKIENSCINHLLAITHAI